MFHRLAERAPRIVWAARLTTACILATVAACGGSEGGNATGSNGPNNPKTGALAVTVSGLPGGSSAGVTITNTAGYSRTVSGTETIASLAPGAYDVTAAEVTAGLDKFGAAPATQAVTIAAGTTTPVSVGYAILTGSLAITAAGLPSGANPEILVTGPSSFSRTVSAGATLGGLAPGAYRLTPATHVVDNNTYASTAATLDVAVAASTTPTPVAFTYALASGSLVVTISGLPTGASGTATVTGPNDFRRTAAAGERLVNLTPGRYTVSGDPVTVGLDGYRAPAPVTVDVAPSISPVSAALPYALATGRLSVNVGGLPGGASAAITVTGPNAYSQTITETQVLTGLAPGDYTIVAAPVTTGALTYTGAPTSQVVAVTASAVAATATVTYAVTTGSLVVTITGLPQAVPASITVTGPSAYSAQVANTSTLSNLTPGTYTITANNAVAGTHTYAPTPATRTVTVTAGATAASAAFTYALASGGIAVTITGLPNGTAGDLTITGPNGYSRAVTATTLILGLPVGTYTIAARAVGSGAWAPNPASQNVAVAPSTSAVTATVNYVSSVGTLAVTINGLPIGVNAAVTVTGPGAYSRALTASTSITGLIGGLYTVAAAAVTNSGTTYSPTTASSNVSVGGGATSTATVTYTASAPPPPSGPNLTIDGMHVQQVVQTYAGTVPLVAGRSGLLRVFVKSAAANTVTPTVRVRFYNGATLTSTITISAPTSSVPQTVNQGTLTSSWNYTIPGSTIQPGLRILADVDPTNTVSESSDSDNSFPLNGTPATMDVRSVPTFNIRMVPVLQSVNGLQGGVTVGNADSYLADTRALYPINTVDADVRAAFTTSAGALQSGDANGAWGQILSEVNALRTADGSSRYYYGIVKVSYGSGIAGLGYVPGRAAIGWDYLPSASDVMAHELGHNFGRFHAPSCGAGGPDNAYPLSNGKIETFGYNIATNALKDTATNYDLMGYCNTTWISAYTFNAVLSYRAANPFSASAAISGGYARRGMLVWGRVQNGQVILEPTFEVDAPPSLPQRPGRHRLQGFGALGESLFDFSFDGERVADHPDGTTEHFAFVVPYGMMRGMQPTRVRLAAAGQQAEFTSVGSATASAAAPVVQRVDSRAVRVQWNDAETRGVLVRHPRTGEILAFARGGDALVYTGESSLDLTTSDGVRSARRRVSVSPSGPRPRR